MHAKAETYGQLVDSGVVAVLRGADPDTLIDITDALLKGGVTGIELTADTPGIGDMLSDLTGSFGDEIVVGTGTVLDSETARTVMLAGAEFVVSPSLHENVITTCNRYGTLVAPGVMTPTEAIRGYEAGADLVKVFPASSLGPGHLSAIKGPYSQIPLMPTGGVDLDNAADYIEAGAECVGVGGALVDYEAAERGEFETITERAREFTSVVAAARED
ncbi:2-dehydro-3-deoxyphosphogluconate aldolase/(4S)-4-hydroxy-2-oxoglutarate aldolase [Halohasta litchfieldiae]|jgi:2-dehydro-3-deoxyphosphogluconate aldolase/(4S)-4-hydroxy-2-oxoglutarate aldolase|uniref:2-keto-3-deoxy-phosphogluconate aldolase n=1 Tax=Halohasta litchfieldiae TaxID=1073996 RepID=A0A1H6TG80_9EURY|nr:bifunctional 4-hydroxy-2-oxoglutarate aldolase/2-dehydro-3-deoxy-phosphogluconate aldolase [Halohasta litchfieldiae]ATW87678.1 2-dehydro-3-deoxyphosphogluconate aldolase/(4S)-4-hydroxy-2-oxoglutarate aldolase [Halohasta litchfieldiae]SEI76117.1 2-keto-3-deoxy-phosphogluconate aldolase [Halohasta litchfieldiae]